MFKSLTESNDGKRRRRLALDADGNELTNSMDVTAPLTEGHVSDIDSEAENEGYSDNDSDIVDMIEDVLDTKKSKTSPTTPSDNEIITTESLFCVRIHYRKTNSTLTRGKSMPGRNRNQMVQRTWQKRGHQTIVREMLDT